MTLARTSVLGRLVCAALVSAALVLSTLAPGASRVLADPPSIEARLAALGPAREEERELFAQLARTLEVAESAAAEGDSARAERHRDLALALVRSAEARRRAAELRVRLVERRRVVDAARERLARARAASSQATSDAARLGGS